MNERDELTGEIVDAALKIHRAIGPVYELLLAKELERRGIRAARQVPVSFEYDGLVFEDAGRIDLLVEGRVAVELKSVERFAPVHAKQLLTYLRLMDLPVGLLINFGAATLKEGLHRIANSRAPLRLCASA